MKIYDISMKIHYDMQVYKNEGLIRPVHEVLQDYSTSSSYNSSIRINMHTGAHVDAPLHMIEGGGTIDTLSLEKVVTRCRVIDLTHLTDRISQKDLKDKDIKKDDFILFKTRNSFIDNFDFNFIYLDRTGADYLKDKGIKGVGTDALGIERDQPDHYTHKVLMGSGIVILEGLRLKEVAEGDYFLFAAPLYIEGAEAAPARAVLVEMPLRN